ncbi:uncharacterized protein LOC134766647 [Penaeus indicus]|uniref:uncharacterized protein LOC134766647 n=1 Tax=Penaeus indicus TaxID=29960 RepID=UPI00300CD2BA
MSSGPHVRVICGIFGIMDLEIETKIMKRIHCLPATETWDPNHIRTTSGPVIFASLDPRAPIVNAYEVVRLRTRFSVLVIFFVWTLTLANSGNFSRAFLYIAWSVPRRHHSLLSKTRGKTVCITFSSSCYNPCNMSHSWIVSAVLLVALLVAVSGQRRPAPSFPSRTELELAVNNPSTVRKALVCIRGYACKLPYGQVLRQAGPELIMTGRCPVHVCKNRRQQELAKWMILKIQEKYPELFYNAVHDLSRRG